MSNNFQYSNCVVALFDQKFLAKNKNFLCISKFDLTTIKFKLFISLKLKNKINNAKTVDFGHKSQIVCAQRNSDLSQKHLKMFNKENVEKLKQKTSQQANKIYEIDRC